MPEMYVLQQYRALPLRAKVAMSMARIREWHDHWNGDVCVSFSGGKDSTVLATLVHDLYPHVPLVFADTGLEFPEVREFAKKMGAEFVKPKMIFSEVISKYGYPIISKDNAGTIAYARILKPGGGQFSRKGLKGDKTWRRPGVNEHDYHNWRRKSLIGKDDFSKEEKSKFNKEKWLPLAQETQFRISDRCCYVMKKSPLHSYQKRTGLDYPYIGTLAEESRLREVAWLRNGCNAFEAKKKISQPLAFWTEQDILHYIYTEGIEIASVYGDIVAVDDNGDCYEPFFCSGCKLKCTGRKGTGCIFCGFGIHLEKGETRFQMLARTHPKLYEYCMGGGQWVDNDKYDPSAPEYDGDWKNWNPKKIWVPSKKGLGMRKVFEDCNQLYGKDFIRYE